jgi:fibronectin type 3 domain-containing protein
MKQKTVGMTLRAVIIALALILVAGSPALPPFDGVAYAQTGLSAVFVPDGSNVQVSWGAISGADSYEVWKGDGRGSSVDWGTSALASVEEPTVSYTDEEVTAGATYSYAIRPVDDGTAGTWSNVVNVTIPGGTTAPTGAPTVTVAADGLTAVDVSWTSVSGATQYHIQFWHAALGNNWERISGDQTSPYNHSSRTPGTEYFYVVRAANAGGNGEWSNWRTDNSKITLQATSTLPVVTLTRVDRTTVTISWTSTGGGAEYDLQRRRITTGGDNAGTTVWARLPSDLLTDTTYMDRGANYIPTDSDSVRYEYRVQAVATQAWSSVKSIAVPKLGAVVGTPQNLRPASLSDSSIRISWGAVTGADFYQLQWKTAVSGYTSPVRIDALFYEHTGLGPSTRYTYQVRAVDVNGAGEWSSERSSSTRSVGSSGLQMPKVTGLVVTDATSPQTAAPRSAKLTWNAVADATHYDIQRYDPSASMPVWGVVSAENTVGDATRIEKPGTSPPTYPDTFDAGAHGKTYFYVVSAVKQVGEAAVAATDEMGEWSDYKSVTFKFLPPPPPDGLTAVRTSGTSILLTWMAGVASPADATPTDPATSYTLEWRTDETSTWNRIPVSGRMTHHHTGLSANSAYRYRVRAENTGGSSDSVPAGTDGVRVELGNRLNPPGGLKAEDATTTTVAGATRTETPAIKVSWTAVPGATGYEVQRFDTTEDTPGMWGAFGGENDGVESVVGQATTTSTHSTGVAAESTNLYRVRTVKSETRSDWSAPVSGTARAAIVAGDAPSVVAASTGRSMIRLSWTDVEGASNYELRSVEGNRDTEAIDLIDPGTMTLSGSHRNYVHSNLKPGTLYSYQVRALFGATAMTDWSDVEQQITKPLAPDLSTTNVTANSITLTWSATSFNGARLTNQQPNYHIQRRTTGGDWENVIAPSGEGVTNEANNMVDCPSNVCTLVDDGVDGADEDMVDDGLSASTTYYYRIRATTTTDTPPEGTYTSYWDYTRQSTPSQ